ncbi:hypothetical protein RFI_07833 [Reticulomyxa filosa]|uniref:TUG ubiquitin-like domain-containing protein n=1 Tax=Reticulomyxa filosa TaxID=46433 RepID=X6NSM1_RETFI|nr:hypothetical protein RFI_07833 [Reticulomyxa filosa]|eukprot:ETO29290.1 hypothetical protein RFI_07833 [Reticulomyxa filosa]
MSAAASAYVVFQNKRFAVASKYNAVPLTMVLREACSHFHINSADHTLANADGKALEMMKTMRQAGIPPRGLMKLIRKPAGTSATSIAPTQKESTNNKTGVSASSQLQQEQEHKAQNKEIKTYTIALDIIASNELPTTNSSNENNKRPKRLVDKVPADYSIWQTLEHFEQKHQSDLKLNLTQRYIGHDNEHANDEQQQQQQQQQSSTSLHTIIKGYFQPVVQFMNSRVISNKQAIK